MSASVVTRSVANVVARLPRKPQAALHAYRAAGFSHAAQRSPHRLQAAPLAAAAARGTRLHQLRCLASQRGDDKSWSDIASEAGTLAK